MPNNGRAEGGHGEKKSRHLERAVAALLACGTFAEAAAQVGVSASTLQRWHDTPQFQRLYRRARGQIIQQTCNQLIAASGKAVDSLVQLLDAPNASVVLGAAKAVLELAGKFTETADLEQRISELEGERHDLAS